MSDRADNPMHSTAPVPDEVVQKAMHGPANRHEARANERAERIEERQGEAVAKILAFKTAFRLLEANDGTGVPVDYGWCTNSRQARFAKLGGDQGTFEALEAGGAKAGAALEQLGAPAHVVKQVRLATKSPGRSTRFATIHDLGLG